LENQADNEDFSQVLWTRLSEMPAWAEGVPVFSIVLNRIKPQGEWPP